MLTCDAEQQCQPEPGYGFTCAGCRMNKCFEYGMSLKGLLHLSTFQIPFSQVTCELDFQFKVRPCVRVLSIQSENVGNY